MFRHGLNLEHFENLESWVFFKHFENWHVLFSFRSIYERSWTQCFRVLFIINFHPNLLLFLVHLSGRVAMPSLFIQVSKFINMTSLLTHTVAHFTRPSFRPKSNNQPLKKFLSLAVSWVKVVKNCKILTFKVNFLCQK